MRLWITLAALLVLGAAGALAAIQLGLPDVAATTPHWRVTEWILSTTMENSVERRAASVSAPEDLDAPSRIRAGAQAYEEMCALCHAAPGRKAGEIAEGLRPEPPELAEEIHEWGPAELFWITKHGVRMTGMPAFGPTHSDRELWDLVAFLRRLPEISVPEYRALVKGAAGSEPTHEHGGNHGDDHSR